MFKILELNFLSGFSFKKHENRKQTHYQTGNNRYISYKIHKRWKKYRDMSKVIQNSYGDLFLEEKKIPEEAEVV